MIPSSGKTASNPLHVGPAQVDNDVTAKVSIAPAIILPSRSKLDTGAPAATVEVVGKNDCPMVTAVTAAIEAHRGDVGMSERPHADKNQTTMPASSASGHVSDLQVQA